ncbi:hypothetical protein [uncultured Clostridium sp.]|uniref:hypothetical protein n=1 Tax=uncultured Clostridium sp. TaxID=59620 RepID=UPI00263AA6B4|nr:hypothetical protein [uncultured Clostridium sp.]
MSYIAENGIDDTIDIVTQTSMSFNKELNEACLDPNQFDSIIKYEDLDDADVEMEEFFTCCDSPNLLDEEIDEDIESDQDMSDEDGELIDIVI